jgi:uncharacterized protein
MSDDSEEIATGDVPFHGEFVWTEIASTDADKCMNFYKEVAGWKFQDSNAVTDGMDYREFSNGSKNPIGGLYQMDPQRFGGSIPPAHFMTYIAVDDVDESAKLAESLGGKVHRMMDVPNVGRMCIIEDPTGAKFSLFKPNM